LQLLAEATHDEDAGGEEAGTGYDEDHDCFAVSRLGSGGGLADCFSALGAALGVGLDGGQ